MTRAPAEACPPGEFILEEMAARGWTYEDVAARMSGTTDKDRTINALTVQAICEQWLFPDDPDPEIGQGFAAELGRAFDVDAQFFLNLEKAWKEWRQREAER